MWQAIPDIYGQEQVDKIQNAIKAPLQDQLDKWEMEDADAHVKYPITNESVHAMRNGPSYKSQLDHDYERIAYERELNNEFQHNREKRYDDLIRQMQHHNY